jgi:hypothetical protein
MAVKAKVVWPCGVEVGCINLEEYIELPMQVRVRVRTS